VYLSITYTERSAEAGIEPSVGSVGDSYDNALAETINGAGSSQYDSTIQSPLTRRCTLT
jgi:transposase InsO family protein